MRAAVAEDNWNGVVVPDLSDPATKDHDLVMVKDEKKAK